MTTEHAADRLTPRQDTSIYETDEPVLYASSDGIATLTLNRPQFGNAQNSQMTYALDAAFRRAVDDDAVRVIVLRGAGKHFNAGHDIGTPGQDLHKPFERVQLWWDHSNKPGGEEIYSREQEIYIGMCRRWHDIPKPTIAMVHGGCIAGGLMLAWVCDLIVAADDAFFQDPVVRMGVPGVEYFAHAHELNPRIAKEFLFLGERMSAERAYMMGMVSVVVRQINSRFVFITGKVNKPGPYQLFGPMSVLQLIAMASGVQEYADKSGIVIVRDENGKQQRLPFNYDDVVKRGILSQNIVLKPGDTVVVP